MYGKRRSYARKRTYRGRRPVRKYRSMRRPTTRSMYRIAKKVVQQSAEHKYIDQNWTNLTVAANGATLGSDGTVFTWISMPNTGTGSSNRVGNRLALSGFRFNFTAYLANAGGVNQPVTGDIYLLMYKDGGTSFTKTHFLQNDINNGDTNITMQSFRNPDHFKDFVVLRKKRIYLDMDTYQGNVPRKAGTIAWKGKIPVSFHTSNTPTENSLFLCFVADSGFTSSAAGNTQNCFIFNGNSRTYFTDI